MVDDTAQEKKNFTRIQRRFVTLDSTFPTVGTRAAPTLPPASPPALAWYPPSAPPPFQIPSSHYRRGLKKTSFMFYKARELTGNEIGRQIKREREKNRRQRGGICSPSPGATRPWLLLNPACVCECVSVSVSVCVCVIAAGG